VRFRVVCLLLTTSGEVVPVIPQQQEICIIRISPTTRRVSNVIVEFSAAMSAIKETAVMAKGILNAKTQTEINSAVSDMLSKLTSVQFECVSLIEMVRSYQEEAASLKAKIAEIEDFQQQAEGYKLNKLDSGTLVYSKKQFIGDTEITVHLCPQCFGKKVISVLQPMEIMRLDAHFRTFCPACNNKFWMNSR
jgi:predicted nuclease with TOPRIM domain